MNACTFQIIGTLVAYFVVVKQFADESTKLYCEQNMQNTTTSSPFG